MCRSCRLTAGRRSGVDFAARDVERRFLGGREGCTEADRRESLLLSVRLEELLPREKMEEMRLAISLVCGGQTRSDAVGTGRSAVAQR